jgi:proline dehydrogenase
MANVVDRAVVRLLPAIPKPIVRKISNRYIAGPTLEDACGVVSKLNAAGKMATVDVLGEHIDEPEQARALVDEYDEVLDAIERSGLDDDGDHRAGSAGLRCVRG